MFIDSHCHLDFDDYGVDLPEVLARARQAGVDEMLTVGCVGEDVQLIGRVPALVEGQPDIWGALGVHPHDARFYSPEVEHQIVQAMKHPKLLAWGEIGLDFHYDFSPRDQQKQAFRRQLRVAQELGKPVIIHTREAEAETCEILEQETTAEEPGVLHCFTSDRSTADRCLVLGFYIGFGGILSFKSAADLREIAKDVPAERLLIETDSPYLAPVPHRGRRNEPALVVRVAEVLAEIRGTTPQEIGAQTAANFNRLFKRKSAG